MQLTEGDFHLTKAHNGAPRVPADTQATHDAFPSYAQCPELSAATPVPCDVETRGKRLVNESSSNVLYHRAARKVISSLLSLSFSQ